MSKPLQALDDNDSSFADDPDFADATWSLDDLDASADLGSVRSAWAGSGGDGLDF